MPLAIPPGFAHVAVQLRNDGDPEPWYITYGIDVSAAGGRHVEVARACAGWFWDMWLQVIHPETKVTGCQLTVGQDGPDPLRLFVAATQEMAGTSSTEKLPQNCALLVRKNSALGGRRNRGRLFIPGVLAEGQVSNVGVIAGNVVPIYQDYADNWYDLHETGGTRLDVPIPMVILHSTGLSAIPEPTPVTSLNVDNVISTQRRRLR